MRFRALHNRNYRLFFTGQGLSMTGTWMQRVAEGWLAYRLTHSPLMLGAVAFAGGAPALFLSPLAGVIADRRNRHRMLQSVQVLGMAQAFTLALFTLTGWITPNQLLVLALVAGVVRAFENPVRHSFVAQTVPVEDLSNAVVLNSTLVNLARIVGPVFAGFIVAGYGEGFCFLANGLSFLVPIVCLQLMQLGKRGSTPPQHSPWKALFEGLEYVRKNVLVRSLFLLFAVTSFAGAPYIALLPMFAGTVLGVEATGFAWMITASGMGALVCSIGLASRSQTRDLMKLLVFASLLFGGALVCLALSRTYYLSVTTLLFVGGAYMLTLASTQIPLQTLVPDELRGRVMSFYSLVFLGFRPFGSLFAGWIAEYIGVATTLALGGVACLGASLIFALNLPKIRAGGLQMRAEAAKRNPHHS